MKDKAYKILVYGIGNPGRQDDGVGIVLAEKIEKWKDSSGFSNIDVTQNYQLNIEDADLISHYNLVIFADASIETDEPFKYEKVKPDSEVEFTMHSVVPSFVLNLCRVLFNSSVIAYKLHIKAEQWEFMKPMSLNAQNNLEQAISFLKIELEKILYPEKLKV